jgi:hypothetical protein
VTACQLDGSLQVVIDQDRYGQTLRCPFCRQVTRDDYDPTPANDLQRAYDPRSPA